MFGLSKPLVYGIAALVLAALISLGIGMSLVAYRGALSDAAESARKERDAHWTAEIEKSNRLVAEARLKAAEAALETDRIIRAAADREKQLLSDLEKANAALPDAGSVGLSRERVCLIDPSGCQDGTR